MSLSWNDRDPLFPKMNFRVYIVLGEVICLISEKDKNEAKPQRFQLWHHLQVDAKRFEWILRLRLLSLRFHLNRKLGLASQTQEKSYLTKKVFSCFK